MSWCSYRRSYLRLRARGGRFDSVLARELRLAPRDVERRADDDRGAGRRVRVELLAEEKPREHGHDEKLHVAEWREHRRIGKAERTRPEIMSARAEETRQHEPRPGRRVGPAPHGQRAWQRER